MAPKASPPARSASGSRRRQILEVGTELFAEHGYHGTSIRDIAEACQLQPASLYSHFHNKEEVLQAVLEEYLAALLPELAAVARSGKDGATRLVAMIETALSVGRAYRSQFLILSNDWNHIRRASGLGRVATQTRRCESQWTRVLKDGVGDGSLRCDVPLGQMQRILFGAVAGMLDTRYDDLGKTAARRGRAPAVLLEGLGTRTG